MRPPTAAPARPPSEQHALPLLAMLFCATALALRLPNLGAESLWYDETVSAYLASRPLGEMLVHTSLDIHPPGYYLLLHWWTRLGGSGEYALAFLSLWFGVLLVAITYRATKTFAGDGPAALAAALAAFSAYSVWYSQEVRMYTVGACLCAGLLTLTLAHVRRPRLGTALAWAALAAASLYVLYYALFLVAVLSLALLAAAARANERRRCWHLWLAAQSAVVIAYLPWLGTALRQAVDPPVPPWRSTVALTTMLRDGALAMLAGESLPAAAWPIAAAAVATAAAGAWAARRQHGWLAFASFAGPWLALIAASAVTPLFHARYLFPFAPGFWACLATAIAVPLSGATRPGRSRPAAESPPQERAPHGQVLRAPAAWPALLAIAAYVGLNAYSLCAFWTEPAYRSDDLRAAVRQMADEWCPGDVVLANAGYIYTAIAYYWPGPPLTFARLAGYNGDEAGGPVVLTAGSTGGAASLGWGDPRADFYATTAEEVTAALTRVLQGGRRLWQLRLYDTVTDPHGETREWLRSRALLVEDRQIDGPSYGRLQAYVSSQAELGCREPTDWDGQALVCATIGSEWGGYVPVRLAIGFGTAAAAPHYSLRLIGPDGQEVVRRDGVLGGTQLATDAPATGLIVPQSVALPLDAGSPAGRYEVQLGLYAFADGSLLVLHPSPSNDPDLAAQGLLTVGYVEIGDR